MKSTKTEARVRINNHMKKIHWAIQLTLWKHSCISNWPQRFLWKVKHPKTKCISFSSQNNLPKSTTDLSSRTHNGFYFISQNFVSSLCLLLSPTAPSRIPDTSNGRHFSAVEETRRRNEWLQRKISVSFGVDSVDFHPGFPLVLTCGAVFTPLLVWKVKDTCRKHHE